MIEKFSIISRWKIVNPFLQFKKYQISSCVFQIKKWIEKKFTEIVSELKFLELKMSLKVFIRIFYEILK